MPFGINNAPGVWQRKMQEHVEGLHGVEMITDDFFVVGFRSIPEEWNADMTAMSLLLQSAVGRRT
jgi:hypothetical protein